VRLLEDQPKLGSPARRTPTLRIYQRRGQTRWVNFLSSTNPLDGLLLESRQFDPRSEISGVGVIRGAFA